MGKAVAGWAGCSNNGVLCTHTEWCMVSVEGHTWSVCVWGLHGQCVGGAYVVSVCGGIRGQCVWEHTWSVCVGAYMVSVCGSIHGQCVGTGGYLVHIRMHPRTHTMHMHAHTEV